jgi:long-subunit fatty acid transport protein
MQYHASQNFSVGLVYRHKVAPTLKADKVFAYTNLVDGETVFVLPSKLGVGVSGKMDRLHGALDVEYGFYSQNKSSNLSGYNPVLREQLTVPNVFEWQNAITTRIGLEYLLGAENQFPVRIGYVFDGKVGNKMYPTAFGTPPAPSHSLTAGAGFRGEKWQTNLAVAYRFASASVTPADVAGASACASCSKAGPDYNLKILGFYLDFSYRFDVAPLFGGAPAAAPGVPETPAVPSPSPGPLPTPAPSPDPAPPALPSSPPTPAPAPSP